MWTKQQIKHDCYYILKSQNNSNVTFAAVFVRRNLNFVASWTAIWSHVLINGTLGKEYGQSTLQPIILKAQM
jgi:hypothetical protein